MLFQLLPSWWRGKAANSLPSPLVVNLKQRLISGQKPGPNCRHGTAYDVVCRNVSPPRLTAGAGFASAFSMVEQALELSPLDHAEAMGLETWEAAGSSGTIAGFKGRKVCRKYSIYR